MDPKEMQMEPMIRDDFCFAWHLLESRQPPRSIDSTSLNSMPYPEMLMSFRLLAYTQAQETTRPVHYDLI